MSTAATIYQPGIQPGVAPAMPGQAPAQAPVQPAIPAPVYIPAPAKESSLKETIIWGLVGVAGAGLTFILLRKVYRSILSTVEETQSLDTDSSANAAKRIRMAFDNDGWFGTDEEALRAVLRGVGSQKEWQAIGKSYQRLYSTPLMRDMESELTSSELTEMMAIINSKPDAGGGTVSTSKQAENWARRLYAAFTVYYAFIPGTDEDAVKAVFMEIPTQSAFDQMTAAYQNIFGAKFMDDLMGDMWDWADYIKIITSKPR